MEKTSSRQWAYLGLYILLLFGAIIILRFDLSPLAMRILGGNGVTFALVEPVWKLLFWITPMLLFLASNTRGPILSYLKLDRHIKKGLIWGMIASSFFVLRGVIFLISGYPLHLIHTLDDWLNSVLLVGIIEESVFRGFLYQWMRDAWTTRWARTETIVVAQSEEADEFLLKLQEWLPRRNESWAALLSTLVFAAIHFPLWIALHISVEIMVVSTAFNLFFGLVQCGLLKYSGSLWCCIIFHMMNDLVILLFQ